MGKYDKKIQELEDAGGVISDEKLDALRTFEKETKQLITDEITGRRKRETGPVETNVIHWKMISVIRRRRYLNTSL